MRKGVAVIITERTFGSGSHMGKDQWRGRLRGYTLQVDAVPGGDGRSEDAWLWAKLWVGIVAYAKAIT